ncbi:uncharacterized protein LOC131001285 [Salvia miltiorrhiza]|uniref:uncharacterized protein LOC131001285 n=1 Tax=Salvia miltiorrhiza TaxID=226208 RepID=UPI0025AD07D2|nr:uncharacterized protein LOC131001285 [Salvia miltiorrhiza]
MSESEQKEQQSKAEEGLENKKDEFVEALEKNKDEQGLREAFGVLAKGSPTTCIKPVHLHRALAIRGQEISLQKTETIIQQLNKEGTFSCDDFVRIVNVILAMGAVKKNDVEGLKKAFCVLTKSDKPTARVGVEDVQLALIIPESELLLHNAKQMVQEVNVQGSFNCHEFLDLFKLLEEPGEPNQTKKIYEKLKHLEEKETIIVYGREGVGKTWAAREVANLAVRKHDLDAAKKDDSDAKKKDVEGFDAAIWVYLNRIYKDDDLSLQKSIAYQLFVLADFEDAEAKKADEKKKKELEKKAEGQEEIPKKNKAEEETDDKKEAERKRQDIEELIVKNLDKKNILFVVDGDSYGRKLKAEVVTEMKAKEVVTGMNKMKDKSGDGGNKVEEEKERSDGKKNGEEETKGGDGKKNGEEKKEGGDGKVKVEEEKIVVLKLEAGEEPVVRLELGALKSYKVMKTVRKDEIEQGMNGVMVKPFTWEESKSLATRATKTEGVLDEYSEEAEKLARYFMFRSERLPAQLLLISRIVSYIGKKGKLELRKLRNDIATIKKGEEGVEWWDVLIKRYEERLPKSVLIDCYDRNRPENHFMHGGRAVSFNEVICYWIMEGHLGSFDRVDEAYHKGHRVLMELMDCGLLQKQEADYITPTGALMKFTFHINDYKDFFSGIRPGIGVTFDMSLGRVALADGMIRTINTSTSTSHQKQIISALLLDGNRIGREERPTERLWEHKDEVEILAISDPTSQHFKLPILEMKMLRFLALRGCKFLESLEPFLEKKHDQEKEQSPQKSDKENDKSSQAPPARISEKLEGLNVLEISGPSLQIQDIPDDLFTLMPNLKTLNLSHLLNVKSLPSSFYNTSTQIEFLILRGCKSLQELKSLKGFKDLKVLDVSEATSFEKFEDKSLHSNTKLQVLNLSKTNLKTLPLINQLKDLKFVWLRDCIVLPRIRKIDKMDKLEIFDISGAGEVERFCDPSLEDLKKLKIVDISRTKIRRLPANLGDPIYLYARSCLKLKVVPPVEELNKLEVLDLSGCHRLTEVRTEFFANVHDLRELNLSETGVRLLPFLGDRISLRRLLLSGCESLEKVDRLSCLKELEFLDLSGCKKLMELEGGTFDEMKHLEQLNLSGTGIGGQQKPLPSLSKLESLKQLHVRDCPNLTELPGVEQVPKLQVLDCSGTVLELPPFSKDHPPRVVGAGIESIDTVQLFRNLGAEPMQGDDQGAKRGFKHEDVRKCKWIISNWRTSDAEKLGTPVYGAHFHRLLNDYPSFLTRNLSSFCFLVYPSEAEAKVGDRFRQDYIDEVSLREIYFEQVCAEKMKRCLEIREFKELPDTLRPLIEQAQLVVLVDDQFLKTLLDLRVASTMSMSMKACWIESCSELTHVVAAPPKVEEKTGEAGKGEGEQQKKGNQHKKVAAVKDQRKNAADGKAGGPAKSAEDKSGEPAKGQGNEPLKNAAADNSGESAKGQGGQQKIAAEEKSGDAAKIGGDEHMNAAADNSRESAKGQGDEQKNAAEQKSGDSAKSEGDQQKTTAADYKSGDTAKIGGDEPKNTAADNSGESAKGEGDEQKNDADEKSGDAAKSEGDQQNSSAADTAKIGGDEQKNAAEKKSGDAVKSEGEKQNAAADTAKIGGDEQKNAAELKAGDSDQQSTTAAHEKSGEPAKNEADQPKNAAADEKSGGDQQKNTAEEKSGEAAKNKGEEAKNPAEELETLWISDASKMKSVCEGDIKSVSFKFLKSLYLEYCPELSEICSSSQQLESLETLFIKYCQKLERLFTDEKPSEMKRLRHLQLWGLDKLQKINCKAPLLSKLGVGECPLLEHVLPSRVNVSQVENEGHENLEILHIKSCDNLKSIFESPSPSPSQDDDGVVFDKLRELELSGLPQLQKVVKEALRLCVLRVRDCPSLTSVIAGADGVRDLETLEVKTCEKMEKIIGGEGSKLLEKVSKIELLGLPELETVGATLPKNESGYTIWACPKLKTLPV